MLMIQSTLTQTFMICNNGAFLVVKRSKNEDLNAGQWAFPGGRVEPGEIPLSSAIREISEETALIMEDRYTILDSYSIPPTRSAYAFMFFSTNREVKLSDEAVAYDWVTDTEDLSNRNCIPGIYYHLLQAKSALQVYNEALNFSEIAVEVQKIEQKDLRVRIERLISQKAHRFAKACVFRSIADDTLTPEKYPNA
jgi:ADP-ribose pyrophosphatase YjhB (NUDIX family)